MTDTYEIDFGFGDLKVQLGQFTTIIDSKDTSIGVIINISSETMTRNFYG